jgi:hypothetical protein
MLGKRMIICLCTETGTGCRADGLTYRYEKVGDSYPMVALEVRPWFGATTLAKAVQA